MNFLAHLYLSGADPAIQAGNLFGDEIKGRDYSYLPQKVQLGVSLHRFIDSHADSDEGNLTIKKDLYDNFHKYAGVALDIYFDHFLAKNWSVFSDIPLKKFENKVYKELQIYLPLFSEKSSWLFENMRNQSWLSEYAHIRGMEKTFTGMSKMLPLHSGMKNAIPLLEKHYPGLEARFLEYFPVLSRDTKEKLVVLSTID